VAQAPERLFIALLLDENVDEKLGPALRHYGYDALTVREAGRRGRSDEEQLDYTEGTEVFSVLSVALSVLSVIQFFA
jgi:predicted nuclease of predicted toxin-antitoxin system